jgi:hypothetical protein
VEPHLFVSEAQGSKWDVRGSELRPWRKLLAVVQNGGGIFHTLFVQLRLREACTDTGQVGRLPAPSYLPRVNVWLVSNFRQVDVNTQQVTWSRQPATWLVSLLASRKSSQMPAVRVWLNWLCLCGTPRNTTSDTCSTATRNFQAERDLTGARQEFCSLQPSCFST